MSVDADQILKKVSQIKKEFLGLDKKLTEIDPNTDFKRYQKVAKERADLEPLINAYEAYLSVQDQFIKNEAALEQEKDEEMRAMFRDDQKKLEENLTSLLVDIKKYLIPKDPNDDKNTMIEIRAGAGGDEAGLFVGSLYRLYERYAVKQNWQLETLSASSQGIGGYREIIALIKGKSTYSRLKFEAGVHRVQRVPETETQGRVHTSTVTVAVLPEADEVEISLNPNDLRVDVFRSSGPGGQSVNTTDSAVRITHKPSGLVVTCQDEKSQHKNKAKALKILKTRLLALAQEQQHESISSDRRSQVGTGDRSERIRTYNFPQSRVTDHRIGLTLYNLDYVLEGDLDSVIDPLLADHQAKMIDKLSVTE
jgi:peptide chain release factor 1